MDLIGLVSLSFFFGSHFDNGYLRDFFVKLRLREKKTLCNETGMGPRGDEIPVRGRGRAKLLPDGVHGDGAGKFSTHRDGDGELTPDREFPVAISSCCWSMVIVGRFLPIYWWLIILAIIQAIVPCIFSQTI
jgi:hypothetical protein